MVVTFLCVTNQAKALTLDETLDFHKNLIGWKETESNKLDKAKKRVLLRILLKKKVPKLLHLEQMETIVHREREVISLLRSSISKSIRLQWKIRFQEKELALPKIAEVANVTLLVIGFMGPTYCYFFFAQLIV